MNVFRKTVERDEWFPPVTLTIEVSYDASNLAPWEAIAYTFEVVAVQQDGPMCYSSCLHHYTDHLMDVPDFGDEVRQWCLEDLASHTMGV